MLDDSEPSLLTSCIHRFQAVIYVGVVAIVCHLVSKVNSDEALIVRLVDDELILLRVDELPLVLCFVHVNINNLIVVTTLVQVDIKLISICLN